MRGVQRRLFCALNPIMLGYLALRYSALFTVDPYQILLWPSKKKVIVDIDDPVFNQAEVKLLNSPQVKAIIVTMDRIKAIFQQLGVIKPIYVIPQGVSTEHINSGSVEVIRVRFKGEADLVAGYIASTLTLSCDGPHRMMQGLNDLDFLLAAAQEARKTEPRIKLWLLGEPSKSVIKYVTQGRESWIKLLGYIPSLDILNYISNFDIAVYPRTKPDLVRFRVKIAQYMACGVPIVATNVEEGPSIILKEVRCGIICDSQEDFANTLVNLAKSAEIRLELGKAGQKYARENLDWPILTQRYTQIFNQLCKE
jgi:glycosyltransferase involved in cell wall biosynthesis